MVGFSVAKETVALKAVKLKTKSGIEAIETGRNAPEIGTVLRIGKGKLPLLVKPGDVIVYRKYMENKIYIPSLGEEINFIKFDDIVANLGGKA